MRRLGVAELVVLAAMVSALAAGLLTAALLLLWRCRRAANKPQLPLAVVVSEPPLRSSKKPRRGTALRRALLRLLLCSRRRTRVEPADSTAATQGEEAVPVDEEVATWRERWFGAATTTASRALYTIDEESGGGSESELETEAEPETPFYTPPASPPRPSSGGHSPPELEATE